MRLRSPLRILTADLEVFKSCGQEFNERFVGAAFNCRSLEANF